MLISAPTCKVSSVDLEVLEVLFLLLLDLLFTLVHYILLYILVVEEHRGLVACFSLFDHKFINKFTAV